MLKEYRPTPILEPISCSSDDVILVQANPIVINDQCDKTTRQTFISKVYGTLWCQLFLTSLYIGICNQNHQIQSFLKSLLGINLMYISFISLLILSCSLFCCFESIRKVPYNYLYVIFFTGFMIYSLGYVGIIYNTQSLLLSGISTTGIFSGLTLYAIQTKVDYTIYGNVMITLLFGLLFFGFITFSFQIELLRTFYSVGGAVIFSFYIVYDTQLIMGGVNRKIQYTTDDFAIASVNLYLDVVNIFLFILDILHGRS